MVSPLEAMSPPSAIAEKSKPPSDNNPFSRTRNTSITTSDSHDMDYDEDDEEDDSFSSAASSFDDDGENHAAALLNNLFASLDNVTIETLKARLAELPEGQNGDLAALLRAAKIDLTLDEIVLPPLTHVKKVMEVKALADWQVQLCIKIRRRKKNTVSGGIVWGVHIKCIYRDAQLGCPFRVSIKGSSNGYLGASIKQ
jgi:hypothetical protein